MGEQERDYQLATSMTRSPWRNYSQHIPEAAMAMKMAPGANPCPGRVTKQEQSGPQNLSAMAAELCIVFGRILRGLGLFHRE